MGSEGFVALEALGVRRRSAGEESEGPPESYTIVGLDVSAERLLESYPDATSKGDRTGHPRARAIIAGVRDQTRVAEPPPEWFVESVGHKQEEPIVVANLGPDRGGKTWLVVVRGRQRTMALREWNSRQKPENRRNLFARIEGLRHTAAINAELGALLSNVASNTHVAMRLSQKADHALMMRERGVPNASVAVHLGIADAAQVAHLLTLADCAAEVKEAVDAGRLALAEVSGYVKLDHDEQRRRVLRATAAGKGANGKGDREARDAAAPARQKATARSVVERAVATVGATPERAYNHREVVALLNWAIGVPDDLCDDLVGDDVRELVTAAQG